MFTLSSELEACYMIILAVIRLKRKRKSELHRREKKKRFWIRTIFQKRQELGVLHTSQSLGSSGSVNVVLKWSFRSLQSLESRIADCWNRRDRILVIPAIAGIAKVTARIRSPASRYGFSSNPGDLSDYMRAWIIWEPGSLALKSRASNPLSTLYHGQLKS